MALESSICPLWVISGRSGFELRCQLYPRKRTACSAGVVPSTDIGCGNRVSMALSRHWTSASLGSPVNIMPLHEGLLYLLNRVSRQRCHARYVPKAEIRGANKVDAVAKGRLRNFCRCE